MKRRIHVIALAASVTMGSIFPAGIRSARAEALNDQLRDAQTQQERLRAETDKVGAQLDDIIGEFKRNGLEGGNDVKTLVAIRSVLNRLSDDEMAKVIRLLQQARSEDPQHALHVVADAHASENNIITQLQSLLHEYQRQQAVNDLAERLAALADRQNTNLGYTVQTVRATGGRPINPNDPAFKDSLQVQAAAQTTLQTDITAAMTDLANLLDKAAAEDADRIKKAQGMSSDRKLNDQVASAVLSLRAGTLIKAAGEEKSVRDVLRDLSSLLSMPQDTLGKLKQAAKEVDLQIAEQQQVLDQTKAAALDKPEASDVEHKQGDVVDRSDRTTKNLQNLAPAAAEDLKKAQEKMQQARADINTRQKDPALQNEQTALATLQQAKQEITDQMAKEQARNDPSKDNLDKVKDLQKEAKALQEKQDKLKQQTADAKDPKAQQDAAKAQQDLEQKAQDLQQRAADTSPDAAKSLDDAAQNMDKAQQDLTKPGEQPKAADSQQAASDALKKAQDELAKDEKKLDQDQKEEDKLADLRKKLQEIIDAQLKVQLDTGVSVAKPGDPKAVAPADLATSQNKIGDDTDAFKQALPDASLNAAEPLTNAKGNMDTAGAALSKSDAKSAQTPEKDALADLYKALKALDEKVDDLKKDLAQQPDQNPQQQKDLAGKLDEMQKDVQQAASDLDQPQQPDQQQVAQMQKQEQQISDQLKQMQQDPKGADKQQVQQAQQDAQQAAQDLQNNDLAKADQDMQKAQDAMQKAGQPDAGKPDAGKPDAGKPDAGKPDGGQPNPELGQLAQQQEQLHEALKSQLNPADALKDAAQEMGEMAQDPQAGDQAQQDMQDAQAALADAAQAAKAGQAKAAQAAAGKAQQAMSQAQAAMQMAQSGLADATKPPMPGQPGTDPKGPPDEAHAKQGTGKPDVKGPPKGVTDNGHIAKAGGASTFIGLPARDRQALQQSQAEKYPQAYGPMVEQYLRNLSDDEQK